MYFDGPTYLDNYFLLALFHWCFILENYYGKKIAK